MRPGDNAIVIPSPPVMDAAATGRWTAALPALGGLGSIGFLALAPRSPFIYVAGGLFLVTTVAMAVAGISRARAQRSTSRERVRHRYLRDLARVRDELDIDAKALRYSESSASLCDGRLVAPVATGSRNRASNLILDVAEDADPFCRAAAERLVERHRKVRDAGLGLELGADLAIHAEAHLARSVMRHLAAVLLDLDPAALRIAVLTDTIDRWRSLRWAPHHRHPSRSDRSGPLRLVATNVPDLAALLQDITQPVFLIVDHPSAPTNLGQRWRVRRTTDQGSAHLLLSRAGVIVNGVHVEDGRAMTCETGSLEARARAAAASITRADTGPPAPLAYSSAPLRPIIGTSTGADVALDLREAGDGGDGPHGMLIGATGSGKSELLRLIVCRLIETHDPTELTFAFVDFKGGATFAPFSGIKHLAASITNLERDPSLIERAKAALSGELRRRQVVLAEHGVATVSELARGTIARLLIVVDEFSELIVQDPEMIDVLAQIGRLGRSLGVHLLIASQRLDEGRLKGLDSHLSYRIALRTQSVAESRAVIGTGDASTLPSEPGHGYLAAGGTLTRFVAGYAEAPAVLGRSPEPTETAGGFEYRNGSEVPTAPTPADGPTILDVAVAHATAYHHTAAPIWIPPPTHAPGIRDLYPDVRIRAGRGFGSVHGPLLSVPIGWVDRPDRQAIEVCALDLSGSGGHVGIVGATRTGTSSTAAALALSLATRATPDETVLYVLDLGAAMADLARLPHVAAMATAGETERVRRIVGHVARIVQERERTRSSGPAVVLLIDDIARLREDFEDLEPSLLQIARRGLRARVHLVCTAHRWLEFRATLRDLLGTRIELRLGDPIESEIDRRAASVVPRGTPGRGLTPDGRTLYVAHESRSGTHERTLVDDIAAAWQGPPARGLEELPAALTTEHLSSEVRDQGLCIAVDRATMRAVCVDDFSRFALVIGDPGSGRTSILRSLARQDAERGTRLVVLDPRRTLLDDLPTDAVIGYAPTPAAAHEALAGLVTGLDRRMPTGELDRDQLRDRSWWSGPQLHLVVDDYDLLTLGGGSLLAVRHLLPYAGDIGLRITIARRAAGIGRALHEDILPVLRALGVLGLVLSSSTDEGPIMGMRPGPAAWSRGVLIGGGRPALDVQAVVAPPTDR